MNIISAIIEIILGLAAAILTVITVPYIQSKTTATQQAEIAVLVKAAVRAAEQIYTGSGRGAEKKAYVLSWLQANGALVDMDRLNAMIESAVYSLRAEDCPLETGVSMSEAGTGISKNITDGGKNESY